MSEIHTLRQQVADFERERENYENEAYEREMELARIESNNETMQNSIERLNEQNEWREQRQAAINTRISAELRNTRQEYTQRLNQVRRESIQRIKEINQKFTNQLNKTQQDLKILRRDTREAISSVRGDIKNLDVKIEGLKKLVELDRQTSLDSARQRFNDIKLLISEEFNDPFSGLSKWKPEMKAWFESRIKSTEELLKTEDVPNVVSQINILTNDFFKEQYENDIRLLKFENRYYSLIGQYRALIDHYKKKQLSKVDHYIVEGQVFDVQTKKWSEQTEETTIDLNLFTRGAYNKTIETLEVGLKKLEEKGFLFVEGVDDKYLDKVETRLPQMEEQIQRLEANGKQAALNSNLRLRQAHRLITQLKPSLDSNHTKINFENDDPLKRLHLRICHNQKISDIIFDSDASHQDEIKTHVMEGQGTTHNGYGEHEIKLIKDAVTDTAHGMGGTTEIGAQTTNLCSRQEPLHKGLNDQEVQILN
jgi:hypothetical protein